MSERQIPHLRDIFGVPFDGMQYSPRSRRRGEFGGSEFTTAPPPCNNNRYSEHKTNNNLHGTEVVTDPDSAVSVGSSGEEENYNLGHKKKGKGRSSRRDSSGDPSSPSGDPNQNYGYSGARTLTQRDVRHLERHLSMKKTIRKKIMRDLRQAFVEDPSEFRVDPARSNPDQLRQINLENLSFNDGPGDSNFLEILRGEECVGGLSPSKGAVKGSKGPKGGRGQHQQNPEEDRDSGHGSPTREMQQRYSSRGSHPQNLEDLGDTEEANKKSGGGGFWKIFSLKGRSSKR